MKFNRERVRQITIITAVEYAILQAVREFGGEVETRLRDLGDCCGQYDSARSVCLIVAEEIAGTLAELEANRG